MNAELIKELRIRLGLTQKELADKLGVDQVTVNRWENNKVSPSPLAEKALLDLSGNHNDQN